MQESTEGRADLRRKAAALGHIPDVGAASKMDAHRDGLVVVSCTCGKYSSGPAPSAAAFRAWADHAAAAIAAAEGRADRPVGDAGRTPDVAQAERDALAIAAAVERDDAQHSDAEQAAAGLELSIAARRRASWLVGGPATVVLTVLAVVTDSGPVWSMALVALVLATVSVLAALGRRVNRLAHHDLDHTERFPDLNGAGDICLHVVCSCGAAKPMGEGRLAWSPLLCKR